MDHNPSYAKPRVSKLTLGLGIAFAVLAVAAGMGAYAGIREFVLGWTMTPIEGIQLEQPTATPVVNPQGTPVSPTRAPALPVSNLTTPAWDGTSRVTLLIIGLDYRDWEAGGPPRSDTMMLLTLDPLSQTAGMLSIPRDMWVNIPWVNRYAKINEAYRNGELLKYPNGGGPGLAMATVQNFIGVPINYYAQIDFYAFEKFIDHLDGVNIFVTEEIKVDPLGRNENGTSNTVTLRVGEVNNLDGPAALGFARMRYTSGGDFDRSSRQQQLILAIRDRILDRNLMPKLIQRSGEIYNDISGGIRTNLSVDQVVKLALFAQQISKENIRKGVLGPNETEFAKSPEGLDILIPKPDKIRIVRDQVFTTGGPVSPATVDKDQTVLVKNEGAKVAFRNGTTTPGIAAQTSDYFKNNGLNVIETTNADKVYNESMIYIYNGKPYTAAYLAGLFNIPTARVINQYQPDSKTDIVVVIGQDWVRKNPMK